MRLNSYLSAGVIFSLLLNILGSVVMAACLLISIGKVEYIFETYFFQLYNIIYIRISGCIMAITVIILSILIVIFSGYTNKSTKSSVYSGEACCLGGKTSATVVSFNMILFLKNIL